MDHLDALDHARGRSRYVDDEPDPANLLHAAVVPSPVPHGKLLSLDVAEALASPGVRKVVLASDIPGENQIGPVIQDEPLLAEKELHFQGQPIALVLADSAAEARLGRDRVRLEVEELPAVVDPVEAYRKGLLITAPKVLERGDIEGAWEQCHRVIEGSVEIGGQEHVYLETQRARAIPEEGGALRVTSSTQSPFAGQKAIAKILGKNLHDVEVDVRRLGGGFGGKEDQATPWACLAALGAELTARPVELVLRRHEDILMTGKRHPYRSTFKVGVDGAGRMLAYEAHHYQNSGAATDLSLAVLDRTLFHSTASYRVPNVRIFGVCCYTNLPPMTAFRGFGGPQGMFVMESALAAVADALSIPREVVQERNLLSEGDAFPYGQLAEDCRARRCFEETRDGFELAAVRQRIEQWNASNRRYKKGFALMPVCFGISFTATFMNQASALVHVYTDGSVAVSTGGVEMGQGLSTNIAAIVARAFGIDGRRVRVESTNTRRIANMSPSAASATTLLNGNAAKGAAERILRGLLEHAAEAMDEETTADELRLDGEKLLRSGAPTDWDWSRLVQSAYFARVPLSAHEFFATPNIHFDPTQLEGRPFAYHVYGTALTEVTVDGLCGTYTLDSVRIVHDLGRSLNQRVDLGQVEGGLAQGLGWMTVEDLRYGDDGRVLSGALATYKVPDVQLMPEDLEVRFLENVGNELGPYQSKAVGEPPLMYGIGAFFALRHALDAFRPERSLPFASPLTPERVLLHLHAEDGEARAEDGATRAADGEARAADGATRAADGEVRAEDGATRAADGEVRAEHVGG